MNTKQFVADFIQEIWNQQNLDRLDHFVCPDFIDHSLPPAMRNDADGLKVWVRATGKAFEHETHIEDMVCEEDKVVVKLKMNLRHIGEWRGIPASEKELVSPGFRMFRLADGKIAEHWALIDGEVIEKTLREEGHHCEVPVKG
ncbi:MAG: hypothetical protein GC180_09740 [Bacteroidetes bacterium]|nr:hypothetical protein [Bacteroidota bacterium]